MSRGKTLVTTTASDGVRGGRNEVSPSSRCGRRDLRIAGRPRGDGRLFFFQAEDGIRDDLVTGVQTCALPIYQVGGVERANASGEVPANVGAIRREEGSIGSGEHAHGAVAEEAVGADAVHVHIAKSDVIKNAVGANGVAIAGVTRTAAARAVLGSSKLIINGGGIALRTASLLIDERLDSRHDGRSKRGAACAGPSAWIRAAGSAAVRNVRPTKYIKVAPKTVGREKRNVRGVAHAVIGIAENTLPRRLGPPLAGAADDTGGRRGAAGALAGTPPARCGGLGGGGVERVVAKTGRAVGWVVAQVSREECAGAGIVPGDFWNVGNGGTESRGVAGIPVDCVGARVSVAEIGSADSDVVGSGSKGVDSDAMRCFSNAIVTAGRAAVTGGDENRDALCDGLLISGIVSGIGGRAIRGFALAITDAHDGWRGSAGVDKILHSDRAAECSSGVGASGHFNGSAWSGGAGPFGVEDGFGAIGSKSAGSAAVIGAGGRRGMNLSKRGRGIGGQT